MISRIMMQIATNAWLGAFISPPRMIYADIWGFVRYVRLELDVREQLV